VGIGRYYFLIVLLVPILISVSMTDDVYALTYTVSIPAGSSVPGCEETDQCFLPYLVTIEVGDTVIWTNNDSSAHTVTSGNPTYGPDDIFDSSLLMAGNTFSHRFDSSGLFAYYDMVHPWMQGIVVVHDKDTNETVIDESSEVSTQTNSIQKECHLFEYDDPRVLYIIEFAKIFENYTKNVGFEKYLKGIDYGQSEKISEYVQSIFQSEDFAVMYFEKDLSSEEEKLMIQVSEKYLEYLLDGKNRLISYVGTGYQDAKNEINSIQCNNPESLLVDRDEALNDLEQAKTEREQAIKYSFPDIIEDWEKELKIKKQSFQIESPIVIEQITSEPVDKTTVVTTGEIGLKKGDWVKYQIDVGGEGFIGGMMNSVKDSLEDPDTGCIFSDIEWFKKEVIEINDKNPVFKTSKFCNGKEYEAGVMPDSNFSFFIPVDVRVGDVIRDSEELGELKVVGTEKREYGDKTVDVIKVHSESETIFDNGHMKTTDTSYYEKLSGILLEYDVSLEAIGTPLFGDMSITFNIFAIDFNIPRSFASMSNGGGCLIATATFGTELAPEVQQLREIRDNSLLQTKSGSAFMESFNQFYYSFSPAIADLERENPVFKEAVKLTITPLLSSLSLLNYVDMDSDVEVLGYGISLILLNIGMYFVAPILAIIKIKK